MHIDASCPSSSVWVLSFFANSEKSKIKSQKPSNFGSENSNDKKTAIAWKKLTEVTKGQTNLKCFFSSWHFLQKANERILLYYYETSGGLVFVCVLEEIEDTKMTFWN